MAASNVWGDDDPTDGEWTTVTRSGLSNHSGPAGRYPNNNTAPAAPRRPAQAAPTAGEVAKGFSGLEIEDGSRKLDKYDIPVEVSGAGALVPANGFEEVGLVEAVLRNVARCGCDIPTTVQRYSMLIVLSRLDLMACAQTGSGMTAAFCLPMVSGLVAAAAAGGRGGGSGRGDREALDYDYYSRTARPRTLVLAPTRELAAQIHKEATKISHQTGIKIKVAYVGSPMFQQLRDIERSVDILVAAPRRPVDMIERSKVSLEAIKYLVIDEAHRMLDMGSDPLVRKIVDGMGMPQNSVRQMKLFSATFSPQIQLRDIGVDILVATPGRHVDMIERSKVSLEAIKYLVMDEADRMLDMGSDPQDRKIVDGMGMPRNSVRQTMLFSATFLPQIQRLASNFFSKYIFITVVRVGSSTDLITQKVEFDYNDYSRMARLRALVLVPARKFATQIHKEATKISHQTGIKIKVAYVGSPMFQQGINILVATPGRLVDMIERSKVSLEAIKYLVMDEADMMLDMGFDPQIRKIVDGMGIPRKSVRQTMLFIATFPPQMQRLASYFVSKYIFITVGRVGSNLITTQKVEFFTYDEKKPYLLDLQNRSLTSSDGMQPLTLVFVETKRDVDSSRYLLLYNKGFPATAIHGDRTQEIHEEENKFPHQTGIKVKVAYGGTLMFQQLRDIERGVDILVATPGRHVDMIERSKVSLEAIKYLVMDGAERMLDMGFDPHIRKIVDEMGMPRKSVRQTMLFSATFLPQIQRLASYFVSKYIFITVGRVGSSTDLIIKKVEFVTYHEKKPYLLDLLQNLSLTSSDGKQPLALVFVETKRDADSLRYWLLYNKGFPATAIHGDRTQEERERALRSFKSGLTPIMVATGVAARGLDVPSVSHVINYDLPKSIEDYVHMIGRTGRAGNAGCATAFFNEQNHPISKGQLELMAEAKQNVSGCLEDYPGPLEITSSRPIQGLVEVMDQKICLQFDSKLTIEEVVSKVFNNIGISFDYWVKINGRLAQLDCILSSLVPESDHDFSLYISPRMRGGAVRVPILDHIITFAENVFDVVLFPKELHYRDMTPYFLGLSSQSIEISVLLINLVHRKYPTRCPSHFTKEDILYNSKRNTVSFRADFEYLEYTDELYYQNLLDVATVFSEIFIYDENLLLSNSPAIHVHSPNILPTPLPHGWRRPMLFELLIHDLKQTVYQFVPLDISKNKDYFLSHLGILSDIARFAFLLSCELDLSYDGNEHNIEIFVGLRSEEQQDATVLEGGELRMEEDAEEWAGMEADAEEWAGMEEDAEEWAEMEDVEEWAENEEDAEEWAEIKEEEDRSESPPMLNRHTRFGSDDEEEDNEAEKEEVEEEADEEAKEAEKEVEEEAEKEVEEEAEKEEAKGSGKRKRKRKRKGGKRKKVRQEQGLPSNHIRVDNWFFKADQSDIFNLLLDGRYEFTRLGSQWRYSRNWVTHGFGYLETMEAKQAEAFLQLIFEGLFYNVRLKLHFPDVEVMWGSSPCRLPGNPRWSEDTAKIVRAWVRNRFTTCDHLKIRGHSSVGCMSIRH